ncbi:MAG: isoprenylcysteine carboxylmethyltransferase family protein [Thermoanaerobaculia bacterium]
MIAWLHAARYFLAVLLVVSIPAAVLYWYLIHPFAGFWRRRGPAVTYLVVGLVCVALIAVLVPWRSVLLGDPWPFSWPLALVGLAFYGVAIAIERACRKHLRFSILTGTPELSSADPGVLLTDGIYARTRNPRYLAVLVSLFAFALILNYPGLYVLFLLSVPTLYLVILLEERELAERFGDEYRRYLERVPRLLPRFGSPPC